LIELLVVISIIGILVGLLLPAVNSAREAGRRAKCQSNMRNVVLAIMGYVNNNNYFPPSGEFGEDPTGSLTVPPSAAVAAFLTNPATGAVANFLPGGTPAANTVPMYSWVVPILPYLDNTDLFNQWTMFNAAGPLSGTTPPQTCISYYDTTNYLAGQASNDKIANISIGVLICPDDNSIQIGQGNLSYVVNGGYSLYQAVPFSWAGSAVDGGGAPTGPLKWGVNLPATIGIMRNMGVMFPESTYPHGINIRIPYNIRSSLTAMADGASNTILLSENTLTGVSITPSAYSQNLITNWATPIPNWTSFISANVCTGGANDCTASASGLAPVGDLDGLGWSAANRVGTFANINGGQNLTIEGQYPFSNSNHPGGINMGFCDGGVRFITSTIDGTVYAKIITPAGTKLPLYLKQLPVEQDAFVPN
jgi:prepilin-type processing-associated H-X9-DG protein